MPEREDENHPLPGVGDTLGPLYPGNHYWGDPRTIATNYGNATIDHETMCRHWNGSMQEVISGHFEARCPSCYREHTVDGTTDDARVELYR